MHPEGTDYHLACTSHDYRECHQLLKEEGVGDCVLSFPTIIARRDGVVMGLIGTNDNDKMVIMGPLVIRGGKNPVVAMRLMEAYDTLMQLHGIKLYYFSVEADRLDALSKKRLEDMGMEYWETIEGNAWFKRKLS